MTDVRELHEHVIVVIGAAANLGKACAEHLASRGARVAVGDTDAQASEVLEAAIEDFGRIDAVVIAPPEAASMGLSSPTDELLDVDTVLVDGVRCAGAAFQLLRAQGYGRLVLVASGPAFPVPGLPSLSVVDGALFGLVRALGSETGPVRVNAVAPIVDTPSTASFFDAHTYLDRRRFGPDAVVPVVAFLCHECCEVRGQVFTAGGGRVARVAAVTAAGVVASDAGASVGELAAAIGEIRSLDRFIEPRTVLDELLLVEV